MEDQARKSKQVIVMRKDLRNHKGEKLHTGKLIAQGAHASLAAILNQRQGNDINNSDCLVIPLTETNPGFAEGKLSKDTALKDWLLGLFTKVCVSVNSESELIEIYVQAKNCGLPCVLITDAGLTEFNGVPTKTCLAIGPAWSDEIDPLTGHLPLF